MKLLNANYFLQIETVGPEGDKVIWLLLIAAFILIAILLLRGQKKLKLPSFSGGVKATITKNKIYNPTIVHLTIVNNSKKDISIENPVLRFKKGRKSKAFKIKAVNSTKIYPMFLEAGQNHTLPILLHAFFQFDENLKHFSHVRIEFSHNNNQKKKTRYILLKPTLFRKVKS